ncbi:hypothetical protein D3874_14845 [Oleomonas cavernae]|uniref:Uncharacterized protein n=1 Tax=Oleomonas cavernae TaxID=2320859 RepID=A0A418WDU0_9PROT|nr:hypothetical protein [Oleomonas cavernae]RJF88136.1 hypothetical protein D3874_14845 [Oleomonas cavernae]
MIRWLSGVVGLVVGLGTADLRAEVYPLDFRLPVPAELVLGQTTEADVIRLYGRADKIQRIVLAYPVDQFLSPLDVASGDRPLSMFRYRHEGQYESLGILYLKTADYLFLDGKLIDYTFQSSFKGEAITFDPLRLESVVKGKTTEAEIVALMGPPTGMGIYPAVRDPGFRVLHYRMPARTELPLQAPASSMPTIFADLLIDRDGKLREIRVETTHIPRERLPSFDDEHELPW